MQPHSTFSRRYKGLHKFTEHEASGGIVLMLASVVALILANSAISFLYDDVLHTRVVFGIGPLVIDKPLLLWINDGLMAIFFFLVGLEIKRELLVGELSSVRKAALPAIAAVGGMLVPALIYLAINANEPALLRGWAIPAATDIAFAVGVLALLGSRVPVSLKIFLLALAIIDDLGAIIIIALFYTSQLSTAALVLAGIGVAFLAFLNWRGEARIWPYVVVGLIIWICVLKSGVHATLAGVVTALAVPFHTNDETEKAPLDRLKDGLHNWVTFGVLPLFAFANAGVSLAGVGLDDLAGGIPSGIAAGLVIGKPVGIVLFAGLAISAGLATRPAGATWAQFLGVGCLAGIGFTMSLFIGMLAFPDPGFADDIRLGVLLGSITSALLGYTILALSSGPNTAEISSTTASNRDPRPS